MKAWYSEDRRFRIKVLRIGKANPAEECRLGLEPADTFECTYGMPAGLLLHVVPEAVSRPGTRPL